MMEHSSRFVAAHRCTADGGANAAMWRTTSDGSCIFGRAAVPSIGAEASAGVEAEVDQPPPIPLVGYREGEIEV